MKIDFKRNLPHKYREDAIYAVNFRLAGTLPRRVLSEYLELKKHLQIVNRKPESKNLYHEMIDPYLDQSKEGPLSLMDPIAVDILKSSLFFFEKKYSPLYAFV